MSKERLEVIEAKLIMAKEDSISSFTDEFLTEMEYLIDRVKEQSERVQELEDILKAHMTEVRILENANKRIKQQNKHYREVLEFYAEGNHVAYKLDETDDDLVVDYGEKARKALE